MKIYAGIDLHSNNAVCALVDQSGRRLERRKLDNQLPEIERLLRPYKTHLRQVAIEATYNWYWLVDGLQEQGYPVVLANPAAMHQYEGIKHTDDVSDAFFVAELARLGILPRAHICERKLRPFRDMLRRRMLLVHQRTSLLLSLKSLYARNTGQTLSQGGVKRLDREEIPQLFPHPADQLIAGEELKVVEQLNQSIGLIERSVEAVADKLPCYRRLQTLPGVGRILALTITMETADIGRFPSAGDYASYCRCVNSARQSNGKSKGQNNSKCGNKYLGWAFVEATHCACRYDAGCRKFYERKKARTNTMVATKALACKLSKAAWHIMNDGQEYDARRVFPFLQEKGADSQESELLPKKRPRKIG